MNESAQFDGRKLGEAIDAQGRKRRWLAQQIGVSETLVSYIISGRRTLTPEVAQRAATVLGIPVFFLRAELQSRSELASTVEETAA